MTMSKMGPYIELLRIQHWVKNVAVLVALPFVLLDPQALAKVHGMLMAFTAFCLVSSACYAINDVIDRAEDLLHPKKKTRPIARGAISPSGALVFAAALAAAAVGTGLLVPHRQFLLVLGSYFVLMLAYSLYLKHQAILDVIIIAIGFVLRAVGGAIAIGVYISPWLIVCTFTLCLFLGFGKRRSEIYTINNMADAARHRKTLTLYTANLLNQLLSTTAGVALVTFMLYCMDSDPLPGQTIVFDKKPLLFTFPLVTYGLFRYAMLIETGKVSGPTDVILRDRTLLAVVLVWILASAAIITYDPLVSWISS